MASINRGCWVMFQHTAARRRLDFRRPFVIKKTGFNTQPPEGGWPSRPSERKTTPCFNTQPPEGGWVVKGFKPEIDAVSTHSRPKAAGQEVQTGWERVIVSTHSRPKAAGRYGHLRKESKNVSTHSRPKAAGCSFV